MRHLDKAKKMFKEFHLKDPDRIVSLKTRIPKYVFPVGYCAQISYHSNKWMKDNSWQSYIHWWDHETIVCVPEYMKNNILYHTGFRVPRMTIDLGDDRNEVTFLGYAIDFHLTEDDRTKIDVGPSTVFIRNMNPQSEGEIARLEGSYIFEFNCHPGKSKDYVVCSPNGKIVYVISDSDNEVYAFINKRCKVTSRGIEG